jgi:hypothetical protein
MSRVTSVRVIELFPSEREISMVRDPTEVSSIVRSGAFVRRPWVAADERELIPLFRVELLHGEQSEAVYFMGINSHPPRFPCYSFCTGWWLGTTTATGEFDTTKYVGLPESVYFPLVDDLRIPSIINTEGSSQHAN